MPLGVTPMPKAPEPTGFATEPHSTPWLLISTLSVFGVAYFCPLRTIFSSFFILEFELKIFVAYSFPDSAVYNAQ